MEAPTNVVVSLVDVTKRFGSHTVVDSVSADVAKGEVLAIVGSQWRRQVHAAALRQLARAARRGTDHGRRADGGGGRPLARGDLAALRRRAGMVFQAFNLFPHMTVLENVSFAQTRVLDRSRDEAARRSTELLEQVGLADKADTYPQRCSGGQQQRAAIARALALEPEVMLFDEPTSALDPELGLEVLTVMRQLADEGMTMIVVTHEMNFAKNVADEVAVMADGRLIERGSPQEVLERPKQPRTQAFLRAVLER